MMEIINCTLGQKFITCLAHTLEGYQDFMTYTFILLVTVIILNYPNIFSLFMTYLTNIFYYTYKYIYNLPEDVLRKEWDRPRYLMASFITMLGKLLHGYEVCGIENLPEGPGLIIYYHGALPIDYVFFVYTVFITTGRLCYSVVDHCLHLFPFTKLCKNIICLCKSREECIEKLKKGYLLGIAPGGLREQNYGDNTYKMIWGNRKGFAQVAIDAKVPIIPMFTQNIREGYRTYGNIWPMRWLFEKTRRIFFPSYGLIPVKLRTHIGEPIPYDPSITAEELAEKTKIAIEALRDKHQKIPGSIRRALLERFANYHKDE